MMGSTLTAMTGNLLTFEDPLLIGVGGVLFALGVWLLFEAGLALFRPRRSAPS